MRHITLILLSCVAVPAYSRGAVSIPVPIVRQATDYTCGPASAMAVLQYWGVFDGAESDLYPAFDTTEKEGTHPKKMTKGIKKMGLDSQLRVNVSIDELRDAINDGVTVILDLQAWRTDESTAWKDTWEDGHYVVAVGMDNTYLYAMDPVLGTGYGAIALSELKDRWHDYENENGKVWRNYGLGIFVRGREPLSTFPSALQLIP